MRRDVWRVIRGSKNFHVTTFRLARTAIVFSLIINLVLGLAICQAYFYKPERHFYVTNGVVPPTELTSRDTPNESSVPLLANDPDAINDEKILNLE